MSDIAQDEESGEKIPLEEIGEEGGNWNLFLISLFVSLAVSFTWALSTQFSKTTLNIAVEDFYAPYFLMWFSASFNSLCYPGFVILCLIQRKKIKDSHEHAVTIFKGEGLTIFSLVKYIFPFVLLWTGSNYCYMKSLGSISASVAASINSCNAALVYVFGIVLLNDKVELMKVSAVVFAITGVVMVSLDGEIRTHINGILLVIVCAFFAAIYKVVFKKFVGQADLGQTALFMSCIGLVHLVVNAVPVFALLQTPYEWINFSAVPWTPLVAASLLGLIYNFLVNFGIALLNPLIVSVGMLVGIPLNSMIDVFVRGVPATPFFLIGTTFIFISFFLITIPLDLIIKKIYKPVSTSEERM